MGRALSDGPRGKRALKIISAGYNLRRVSSIFMKNTRKSGKASAERIARLAERGEDVSRFFTNTGSMMGPIQRVNVDFTSPMLQELDTAAKELNISRQALIKTLIRQALDQRYLAGNARKKVKRA